MTKVILASAAALMMGTTLLGTVGTVKANTGSRYYNNDWTIYRGKSIKEVSKSIFGKIKALQQDAINDILLIPDRYIDAKVGQNYILQIKRARSEEQIKAILEEAKEIERSNQYKYYHQ